MMHEVAVDDSLSSIKKEPNNEDQNVCMQIWIMKMC